ncbi:MAG: hypothetical protein FWG64_08895 [Firmicutes bacterium]|nr:hypothetical protein [Bacillota bacterium]
MFLKQLKYDLLFSRDMFFGMAGLLIAVAIIMRLTGTVNMSEADASLGILGNMFSLLVLVVIFSVAVLIAAIGSIVQIFRFYKQSFFSSSGYFFLTLPINSTKLILSKIVVALIWYNFMMFVAIITGLILADFEILLTSLPNLFEIGDFVIMIFNSNVNALVFIAFLYFMITLANSVVVVKLSYLLSGAISFALLIGYSWLLELIDRSTRTEGTINIIISNSLEIVPTAFSLAFAVLLFACCRYLLKNKVSFE